MTITLTIVFGLLVIDSLLRFLLLCLRWILPSRKVRSRTEAAGCVVLIAARDERQSIGATVAALLPQLSKLPRSRLWVVADHCRDETADEAEAAGARVGRRQEGRPGKGAVIDWWLSHFPAEWTGDATIVVLDADSRIRPGSIEMLCQAISNGGDAAQAFISPRAAATTGRLAGWSEILMQSIDDTARSRAGWQVPLRGTGMAFRADLLAKLAPKLHTFAEDLELDILLAARSSNVTFVPDAVVFDPKPWQARGVSYQRARWLQGQIQVLRDYPREILRALMYGGIGAWMLLVLLLLRPKVLLIGLRLLALVLALSLGGPWLIVVGGLALDAIYYLAGAAIVDNPRRYLLDLLVAPRYALLWVYSFGVAAVKRGWLRAGR